jgi:hypothetical protein
MQDRSTPPRYHAPIVLPENRERRFKVLAFDLFMFTQLVLFHILCVTFGLACYLLDRLTFGHRFLNGFIGFFDRISRLGHKS